MGEAWHALRESLAPIMDLSTAEIIKQKGGPGWMFRPLGGGLVGLFQHGEFGVISASGGALTSLRTAGVLGDYLMAIGAHPYRITRLDATVDLFVDAPPIIASIAAAARSGGVSLSRKAVPVSDVVTQISLDARGVLTGTVYVGSKDARVRGVVYDKRHQQESPPMSNPDPGPWLRYEIRLRRDVGASLHDAWDAGPLFWHYCPPEFLAAPDGVVPWVPHGEGFTMERRADYTPALLIRGRLDRDPLVDRLIELADSIPGPGGRQFLLDSFARRIGLSQRQSRGPVPDKSAA